MIDKTRGPENQKKKKKRQKCHYSHVHRRVIGAYNLLLFSTRDVYRAIEER